MIVILLNSPFIVHQKSKINILVLATSVN